jgi:ketosteroid isomerase-like protein
MAKPYRELLAGSAEAFNARDPEAWLELWNLDCEWHPFLTAREEGDFGYHGQNGIRAWFEDVDEMFSRIHVELDQFREIGDRLVVLGKMEATRRVGGEQSRSDVGWVVEPRGEKLQRGWAYSSHEEAIREAEAAR